MTDPLGEITVPLPPEWSIGEPKYPDENAIGTLYGPGGTRIDLLRVYFSSHDAESGVMAKLFIADPAYTPASFESSEIITTASESVAAVNALLDEVPE